ncbi:sugar phosphate isomerase/epimerase family protein [Candidatus Nitrosotenuis sp. DW1]|uniref:sugar phosphate isomerase/epimerase family protein n=1 Tax=Candidatus Nitrosotenuis sp. DW1 TaxID=2259672 RepID=UPI00210337F8|nr:sugar phosphate isomerase/epimerase family protein [Candidatus Nitrosotenuis sp. DW1]
MNRWQDEFKEAASCNFACIEWIFDTYEKNPIIDNSEITEMRLISNKFGVKINSVCADYFMEKKIFNESENEIEKNLDVLRKLIKNCRKTDIRILEIPLVDSSSISAPEHENDLMKNLSKILPFAKDNDVAITLETDMPPRRFRNFLESFEPSTVFANYDTGNSTALGYDVEEEINILSDRIKNIHIKDRIVHGKTVPLGTGNTKFDLFFSSLKKINFRGDLIIQGAREDNFTPKQTCEKYYKFVKQYVDKYYR